MMRSSVASLLLLLPLTFACATSPSATPATSAPAAIPAAPATAAAVAGRTLNPVGAFDYTAILPDGSSTTGSFTIAGSPGAYTGWIQREGVDGSADIASIAVDGQTLILGTSVSEGPVTLTLNFAGAEFSGRWTMEGASGAISGRRR